MNFYFCEGCGKRITQEEIDAGKGKNKNLKGVFCKSCAVGVSTMNALPLTDESAEKILKEAEERKAPSSAHPLPRSRNKRSSTSSIPSAARRESRAKPGTPSERISDSKATPSNLPVVIVGALLLIGGGGAFFFSGKKASPKAQLTRRNKKPQAPPDNHGAISTDSSNPSTRPSTPKLPKTNPERTSIPDQTAPVTNTVTPSSTPFIEYSKAVDDLDKTDVENRIKLAETFLKAHADETAAPRVRQQLEDWKKGLWANNQTPDVKSDATQKPDQKKTMPDGTVAKLPTPEKKDSAPSPLQSTEPKPYAAAFFEHLDGLLTVLPTNDFDHAKRLAKAMAADTSLGPWSEAAQAVPDAIAEFPKQFQARIALLKKQIGRKLDLKTSRGARSGIVSKVTDTDLTLEQRYTINRKEKVGAIFKIPFSTLSAKTWHRYAPAPKPTVPREWQASVFQALADHALSQAEASLKNCAGLPLELPLRQYLVRRQAQQREQEAEATWKKLVARSQSETVTKKIEKLLAEVAGFGALFHDTKFIHAHTKEREALQLDLEKRSLRSPALIAELFRGQIQAYDIKTGFVTVHYNFKDKKQIEDFVIPKETSYSLSKESLHMTLTTELAFYTDRFDLNEFEISYRVNPDTIQGNDHQFIKMTLGQPVQFSLQFRRRGLFVLDKKELKSEPKGYRLVSVKKSGSQLTVSLNGKQVAETSIADGIRGNRFAILGAKKPRIAFNFKDITIRARPNRAWMKEQLILQSIVRKKPQNVWIGRVENTKWSDAKNWSLQRTPQAGDHVFFGRMGPAHCRADSGTVASSLGSLTLSSSYAGTLSFAKNFSESNSQILSVNGPVNVLGGQWIVEGLVEGTGSEATGVGVTIQASEFLLGQAATFHSDRRGFPGGSGSQKGLNRWEPVGLGVGGKGAGGGAIKIDTGMGPITINGSLRVNSDLIFARKSHHQGGKGGSIFLVCGTLNGKGSIQAKGGVGTGDAGGGYGGQIGIKANVFNFKGHFDLSGGKHDRSTLRHGSAGTLVLPPGNDLIVTSPIGLPSGKFTFRNVIIKSGGHLKCYGNTKTNTGVQIEANAIIIDVGGSINANGKGHRPLKQNEKQKTYPPSNPAAPLSLGPGEYRCSGGGAIRIDTDTATINGTLSANGTPPSGDWAHGGQGGSIWLTCKELTGKGLIQASGGLIPAGTKHRTSGKGGKVAVYFGKNTFEGKCNAPGKGSVIIKNK